MYFNFFSESRQSTSDEFESNHSRTIREDGESYNGDVQTPVFAWRREPLKFEQSIDILLREYDAERLCVSQPVNVSHNVNFLVDNAKVKDLNDLKCDDMGAWKHSGTRKRCCQVKLKKDGKVKQVIFKDNESEVRGTNTYTLKRVYYVNKSSSDVRKVMYTLEGKFVVNNVCYE